ncbi:hypothetical protein Tco_0448517 [Tanacetum coccineum]
MSSITAQQAKLDLELVPKEKRLEIRKCNERLNPGKIQREPTFQVVLDAPALTPCYYAFLITADVPEISLRSALECINLGELLLLSSIEVYLERQLVLTSFVSPEHKSFGARKDELHPKIARKFKKASPSKKDLNLNLVPVDEEPKFAKKKVSTKKTTRKQSTGVVLRDTPVETTSKRKEKVDVTRGKGIELLFEVALTEDAQFEEVRRKRVPDVTEEESTESEAESWGKDKDDSNNEHDSRSEGSDQERDNGDDNTQSDSEKGSDFEHETDENESGSESDQEENKEEIGDDKEEEGDKFVKTLSNDTDNEDETKIKDKAEGDGDEEIDYTTSQLYDDVDIRLNEPVC